MCTRLATTTQTSYHAQPWWSNEDNSRRHREHEMMIPTLVALLLCCIIQAIIKIPSAAADDLFLLSGQSNMDGHATRRQSLTGNATYWMSIKSILTSEDHLKMKTELYNVIYAANERKGGVRR